MAKHFKHIGIIGKAKNHGTLTTLAALIHCLLPCEYHLLIENSLAEASPYLDLPRAPQAELIEKSQLVIVIGGDGSMLRAAQACTTAAPPLLGINRGRLGFLTDLYPTSLEQELLPILNGQYHEEKRTRLAVHPLHDNSAHSALNDVVLTSAHAVQMLEFEIYIDRQFVCQQRADGLIIATPTGSTAYALSAGGPILHPSLNTFAIVPQCAHTLNSRPLVVSHNSVIEIIIHSHQQVGFSCDGQALQFIDSPGPLQITKHPHDVHLIHSHRYDYFDTLRKKLHWGKPLQAEQ